MSIDSGYQDMKLPTITSGSNFVDGYVGVGTIEMDRVKDLNETLAKHANLHKEGAEVAQLLADQGKKNEATSKAILTLVETSNNVQRSNLECYQTWNNHRTRLIMNASNNTAQGVALAFEAINTLTTLTLWQRIKWMLFGKAPFVVNIEEDTIFDVSYSESAKEQMAKEEKEEAERSDDSTL